MRSWVLTWARSAPLLLVAAAVLFNLVVLRPEVTPANNLNDSAVHAQMVRWAETRIEREQLPLDGWYPYLGLGSSRFHRYHSLPHILTGLVGRIFGPDAAFRWSVYLLLALWPISVYLGSRLLGWSRWVAGSAALVSPLLVSAPGIGFEHGSYVWRGSGVWAQLWAMWTLPISLGLSWQAVGHGRRFALAAVLLAATLASHFIVGYLSLLAVGLWVLVAPGGLLRRVRHGLLVGAGGLLAAAWILVPLLGDRATANQSIYLQGSFYRDSFGAGEVLGWLVSGEMFDRGRLPVITLLAAIGLVHCVARLRRDHRARAIVSFSVLSLLLFFGRPTLGPLLRLLPGAEDLFLRRMVTGVHLGGIVLAGVGLARLGSFVVSTIRARLPRVEPVGALGVAVALSMILLLPAVLERARFDARGAELINFQVLDDRLDGSRVGSLIAEARSRGPGRFFAGMRGRWGDEYRIGFVPMYAVLANRDLDAIGFTLRTPSLSTDIETLFEETNAAHYDLFNVRYLILPETRQPGVPATLLARRGRHTLWEVDTSGYLKLVDTIPAITADRTNLATQMKSFLQSGLPANGVHPLVAFGELESGAPTTVPNAGIRGSAGVVERQFAGPIDGFFAGTVNANRTAAVMLKSTYDPRWEAYVNGVLRPTYMVAPSFVAVTVPPGRSDVVLRYVPYGSYPLLLGLGAAAIAGLAFYGRGRRFNHSADAA
ncbi:MAG: DUF6541 family protein [Actinomycetota bacterium]